MGILDSALTAVLPLMPRGLVHLVAQRYVAGSTLDDALATVEKLGREGAAATIDILGEDDTAPAEADATRDAYVAALRAIHARGADANVSIKLTGLGFLLDRAACLRRVSAICDEAATLGNFVRIDMEGSAWTQKTLDLFYALHDKHPNVGIVLQAYLRRTPADARSLAAAGANVRLCKGIYVEPREIAWKDREIVRRNYAWALRLLWEGGASRVGVATHDETLVWEALRLIDDLRVEKPRYEFQMLLGVEDELRRLLVASGHRVRVYVPYGRRWYEYSMRRLKENPVIAGHVARATVGRLLGR